MIIALPFDLRLWTGIDSDTVSEAEAFSRFVERRDRVREFNQHLSVKSHKVIPGKVSQSRTG
jgi:hypothetical protein